MIKISHVVYYSICSLVSIIMVKIGYTLLTWQWWAILTCVIAAQICGREW